MYYPKSQIQEGLYTSGGEYMIVSTSEPYTGYYYQVSNNQRFTGKNPSTPPNNQLVNIPPPQTPNREGTDVGSGIQDVSDNSSFWSYQYQTLKKQQGIILKTPPPIPLQTIPLPTSNDYSNGFFNRYFLYNFKNNSTIETNKSTYIQFTSQSPNVQIDMFTPLKVFWSLTGKLNVVYKSNNSNILSIEQTNKVYGFSNYFKKKYTQYYQYSKNENIYSNGKELKYSKSKKPYIGYYHIHPTKGPMVGRQHTMEAHDYLEFTQTGSILNPIPPTIQSGSYEEPSKTITNTFGGY
jgi:hypothetical protein|tara:strand:- start:174 stop:1052 length:879 start_codon:yes stop_codon:yes gene_type:complete